MEITTRAFRPEDLEACLEVEKGAIKGPNHYMADVIDYYNTTRGEMTVVEVDGKIAGMGKLTVLYDGSAWLELLRVHPDYQRKGCGMAIYKRYMEQLKEFGCPAARLYTGAQNVPSAGLAMKHGFHRSTEFHGMTLTMDKADASLFWEPPMYHHLSGEEAIRELLPMKEQLGGYLDINQTYYDINEKTLRGLAAAGWIYGDGKGSVLVAGARFQPEKALYIAAMKGDKRRALSYALNMMVMGGHQKIAAHFPVGDQEMIDFLSRHGFEKNPSDLVVMEWQTESAI